MSVVGRSMSWGEAIRLMERLTLEPESHVAAALADWEYPTSRAALALYDLFDLEHKSKAKRKPELYPRPWVTNRRRFGRTRLSPAQLRAILDAHRR